MLLYEWLREACASSGGAKALVYRDTYLSWRGLIHRVERRAGEFAAMGIREGDWVGIMLGNVPDFVILALALSKLGAVLVPLDPTTSPSELDGFLGIAPLRGLITRPRGSEVVPPRKPDPGFTPRPRRPPPQPESRRRLQGTLLTCALYDATVTTSEQAPALAGIDDLCLVQFTATSTGAPKGVLRTRANLVAEVDNIISTLKLGSEERILAAAPLFMGYGFDMALLVSMRTGATLFLEDEASAKRVMKLLREAEITFFPGSPSLYAPLCRMPTARPLKPKGLRFLAAGESLDEALASSFLDRLGVRLLPHYHATETGAVASERKGGDGCGVGKLFEGVEVLVTGSDGAPRPAGQVGSIWVRSGAVSPGAVGPLKDDDEPVAEPTGKAAKGSAKGKAAAPAPVLAVAAKAASGKTANGKAAAAKTAPAKAVAKAAPPAAPARANGKSKEGPPDPSTPIGWRDARGWFRTGDIGVLDRTGRLTLSGREDDLVKVEGKRVALSEVERCLRAYPKVMSARAFTMQDPVTGAVVVARVVARSAFQAEELLDHCARNLAPYKVPRRIEFCEELA